MSLRITENSNFDNKFLRTGVQGLLHSYKHKNYLFQTSFTTLSNGLRIQVYDFDKRFDSLLVNQPALINYANSSFLNFSPNYINFNVFFQDISETEFNMCYFYTLYKSTSTTTENDIRLVVVNFSDIGGVLTLNGVAHKTILSALDFAFIKSELNNSVSFGKIINAQLIYENDQNFYEVVSFSYSGSIADISYLKLKILLDGVNLYSDSIIYEYDTIYNSRLSNFVFYYQLSTPEKNYQLQKNDNNIGEAYRYDSNTFITSLITRDNGVYRQSLIKLDFLNNKANFYYHAPTTISSVDVFIPCIFHKNDGLISQIVKIEQDDSSKTSVYTLTVNYYNASDITNDSVSPVVQLSPNKTETKNITYKKTEPEQPGYVIKTYQSFFNQVKKLSNNIVFWHTKDVVTWTPPIEAYRAIIFDNNFNELGRIKHNYGYVSVAINSHLFYEDQENLEFKYFSEITRIGNNSQNLFYFTIDNVEEVFDILPPEDPYETEPEEEFNENGGEYLINLNKYAVIMHRPEVSNGTSQTISYYNDVITSRNLKQQKISLRQNPLLSINYSYQINRKQYFSFVNFLKINANRDILIPLWTNEITHSNQLNIDSYEIEINDYELENFEFINNQPILLYKNENDYYKFNVKYATKNKLILHTPLQKTVLAGHYRIIPLRLARFMDINLDQKGESFVGCNLSFECIVNDFDNIKTFATEFLIDENTLEEYEQSTPNSIDFDIYNNKFALIKDHNFNFDIQKSIVGDTISYANNYGVGERFVLNDFLANTTSVNFHLNSIKKINDFKILVHLLNGSQKSFYMQNYEEIIPFDAGLNSISVKREEFFDEVLKNRESNHIVIFGKNGNYNLNEIISYKVEYLEYSKKFIVKLTLKDPIVEFYYKDFDRFNFLDEVVFTDDQTTYNFVKPDLCSIIKRVKIIKKVD